MSIFARQYFNTRRPQASGYRIGRICLALLLSLLMVVAHTLTLTHRIAHSAVNVGAVSAATAKSQDRAGNLKSAVESPKTEPVASLLNQLLTQFGHEAGDDCQSWDAASSHDANSNQASAASFASAGCALITNYPTPQVLTADLLGLSLARAPPQI